MMMEVKMNKTRMIGLVGGAFIVVAVILISLGFNAAPQARGSSIPSVGMGDLQRYDASLARGSNSSYVGMGDLHRLEVQKAISAAPAQTGGSAYIGMGDLRNFEALQAIVQKIQIRGGR
jgi:hypothetical protein